jgi:hypothetical protein
MNQLKVAVNKTRFENYCSWLLNNIKGRGRIRKSLTNAAKEEIIKIQ